MREYILRRVLLLPFIMFGVAFMTFLAYRIIPGDAAILHCQLECTPDTVAALRHEFGLDRPPLPLSVDTKPPFLEINGDSQFGGWLGGVLRGDLGSSFSYRTPVTDELGRRVPITVELLFLTVVLALGESAVLMRLTRSAMLEVMRNDYIRTAWSKGLRERAVVWRHALKNAIIPIITVIGLQIGGLLGGAVIIESLYNLNGMGKYILEAIIRRDIFVVQSVTLLFAVSYVVANLFVDLTYAWLDPRIRYA